MSFTMTASGTSASPDRRIKQGSEQQEAFWDALLRIVAHLRLDARAGCGKSTSCREGMHRIGEQDRSIRSAYVAFNRSIADEFRGGLPHGATATTMHSAGFAALRNGNPGIGSPDKNKVWDIAQSFKPGHGRHVRKVRTAAVKLVALCKSNLIGDPTREDGYHSIPMATLDRLCASFGIDVRGFREEAFDLVEPMLCQCFRQANRVDFNDMIWLPVMLGLSFDPLDFLFVDEAQDLDPCQHALVRAMAGKGRLVMVGDPYQAIYAFRGADSASMDTLAGKLAATDRGLVTLPLTFTRRCPSSHVELAARIVPDFAALPEAPEGMVIEDARPDDVLRPGVLALARTNAPLVATAFRLAAAGRQVAIQGRDIGEGLIRFVEDFEADTTKELARRVADYRAAELDRLSELDQAEAEVEAVNDRCGCVEAMLAGKSHVDAVVNAIRQVFQDPTPANASRIVLLSSIHRAKGREADRVVMLNPEAMPSPSARTAAAIQQEMNLIYVASTRSKRELAFCGPLPDPLVPMGGGFGNDLDAFESAG